jgi:uncharacterized membrane protein required for colicin V production
MNFPLSWPDLVAGALCFLVVASAARRGLLREGSLLIGLGAALWLAGLAYRQAGSLILRQTEWSGALGLALYLGVALVLLVILAGLSSLAAPLVRRGPLLGLDRAGGVVVGLAESALLAGVATMAIERLGVSRVPPGSPASRAAEFAGASLVWLAAAVPAEVLRLLPAASGPG